MPGWYSNGTVASMLEKSSMQPCIFHLPQQGAAGILPIRRLHKFQKIADRDSNCRFSSAARYEEQACRFYGTLALLAGVVAEIASVSSSCVKQSPLCSAFPSWMRSFCAASILSAVSVESVSLVVFSGGQSDHRIVRKQSAERLSSPTAAVGCDWHGAKLTRPQIKEKKSSSMSCFFGRSSRNRRRFAPSPGPRISPLSVYAKKFLC